MDNQRRQLVVFTLEEQRYALDLSMVRRVFRSVEITPLPKAPDIVLGVISVIACTTDLKHLAKSKKRGSYEPNETEA